MGLDEYKKNADSDDEEQDEEPDEEEPNGGEEKSGLDAYKGKDKSEEIEEDKGREVANPWIDDFSAHEWNSMETDEKVRYVRDNYDASYRPDVQIDDRWSYEEVTWVTCVCDNSFTFSDTGMCLSCGRQYKEKDGAVVLAHEPDQDNKGDLDG